MTKTQVDASKKPRRWFVIGPGIILAVILAIQVVIINRKTDSAPPVIEHYVSGSGISSANVPIDGINSMFKVENKLALTSGQREALSKLNSEWKQKSSPLDKQMSKATEEFDKYMSGNQKGKAPVSEIQSHAASVSGLSGQAVSLRKIYWQKALMILNAKQRNILNNEIFHGTQNASYKYDVKRSVK